MVGYKKYIFTFYAKMFYLTKKKFVENKYSWSLVWQSSSQGHVLHLYK